MQSSGFQGPATDADSRPGVIVESATRKLPTPLTLETPVAPAKKASKRGTTVRNSVRTSVRNSVLKSAPEAVVAEVASTTPPKSEIRTLLVASYGWPTDAALPVRRTTRR